MKCYTEHGNVLMLKCIKCIGYKNFEQGEKQRPDLTVLKSYYLKFFADNKCTAMVCAVNYTKSVKYLS